MKMKRGISIVYLLLSIAAHAQSKSDSINLNTVLSSLYDVSQLPKYLDKTYSGQVSSYDTTGGNDDGFSGKYSFLRRNADSTLVLFDVKGPGVINRIWTPTPTDDTLDFYFDGNPQPGLSVKFSDLFSGKQFPFTAPLCGNDLGGFYCYFPLLFNNGCTVVARGKKVQFHQFGYRLYPPGTLVQTFPGRLTTDELKALQNIDRVWSNGKLGNLPLLNGSPDGLRTVSKQFELLPGQSTLIFNAVEGGRIEGIECSPTAAFEGLSKLVDIEITWDDDTRPAVYCPLADFFGYAFGRPAMQSLLLGTRDNINYSYFPMPFDRKASIRLRYRKALPGDPAPRLSFSTRIYFNKRKRVPAEEGRFYTSWNRVANIGQPHVFLQTKGRGHYVGTLLQAQGLQPGMMYFFEGDDSTVVDGSLRMHGTGSEDYFNGGWYALADRWDGKLSLPMHGCLDYSLPFCRTGAYRFYLSDKISFQENILHSIEHGPAGNQVPVDYTSLGFYYAGAAPVAAITPSDELSKVYQPDTLIMYPQLMNAVVDGKLSIATAWKYNTGGLSYTYTAEDAAALKISIAELPLGKYRLLMDFVRNTEGAAFSVWQGQHNLSGWMAANATAEEPVSNFFIAGIEHTDSRNTLTIHFKTSAGKEKMILNRLIFVRLRG